MWYETYKKAVEESIGEHELGCDCLSRDELCPANKKRLHSLTLALLDGEIKKWENELKEIPDIVHKDPRIDGLKMGMIQQLEFVLGYLRSEREKIVNHQN